MGNKYFQYWMAKIVKILLIDFYIFCQYKAKSKKNLNLYINVKNIVHIYIRVINILIKFLYKLSLKNLNEI